MNIRRISYLFCILLITLLAGNISCNKFDDLKSPIEGFRVILNYDVFDTFINFRFIDAPSGELIGASDDEKTKLTISGANAEAIVDQLGNHDTIYHSVFGIISLALNPNDPWVPAKNNRLEFYLKIENENYNSSELKITIDSTGNYSYDVYLEPNNVESLGVKENTYFLELTDKGLSETFWYSSSGNELSFSIPEKTRFEDVDGKAVSGSKIKINIKYFLKNNKSGLPLGLINTIQSKAGIFSKKATDFYQVASIMFTDEKGNQVFPVNSSFDIKMRMNGNFYNPVKHKKLSTNDSILALVYTDKNWAEHEKTLLLEDSLGAYGIIAFNKNKFYALANCVNTCSLNYAVKFNLTNNFERLPVGARVYIYRKTDNRYFGNKTVQIEQNHQLINTEFLSIENEPIKLRIQNQSSNNPFTVSNPNIFPKISCGTVSNPYIVEITSKRVEVSGNVSLKISNEIPPEGIKMFIDFYNTSNNARVFRKPITVFDSFSEHQITTGMLENQNLSVKLVSANNQIILQKVPELFDFNSDESPFEWNFEVSWKDISKEIEFNFTIHENFEDGEITLRADFLNIDTNKTEKSISIKTSRNNTIYAQKLVLDYNSRYKIKLKRFEDKEQFMAYPYELQLDPGKETYSYNVEILPVEKEEVSVNVRLICGSSTIYPSVSGMFRTVWDDKWQTIDIADGNFSQIFEIGGTYEVGTIFEGELVSTTYKVNSTIIDLEFELEGEFCDSMGW